MSKELLQSILPEFTQELKQLIEHLSSLERVPSVDEMEVSCRQMMQRIGGRIIEQVVLVHNCGHEGQRIPCSCGGTASFEGYRPKTIVSMIGQASIRRAWYHCPSCNSGFAPLDEKLGLTRRAFSEGVERSVCRLSAVEPFELVSKDLYELAGVSVSAKECQLLSEAEGMKMAEEEQAEVAAVFEDEKDVEPEAVPDVLCVQLDGKIVPMQDGGRELKVAAICDLVPGNDPKRLDVGRTTYLGRFVEAKDFGRYVWAEAARRGAMEARIVIGLGDGAVWIWNLMTDHFPQAVQILDFYHVSEHLWDLGKVLYGEGTEKTKRFVEYKLDQIWEGDVGKVIAALRKLKPSDKQKAEELRLEINYLVENKDRMDYPSYRKMGYHIGSGVVESACKQFGARLDQAGMRWVENGAGAIAVLRAVKLSGRWDKYWKPARAPLYA